jgi:uncharacterized protein YbjT (DUF2867 family)
MRVLVAGAHGKVARLLVRELVGRGHEARGLIRKEEQAPDVEADGAEPVLCDLESEEPGRIGDAVKGCDAVVFAAGAGPGSGDARKQNMDYGGAVKLIRACEERGVRRYVMLSSTGAADPESRDEAMRPYLRAKARADERLRESGLEHTIVRPGRLTDDPGTRRVDAAESLGRYAEIPREDVALAMALTLELENTVGKTFDLLSGETSVEDALKSL